MSSQTDTFETSEAWRGLHIYTNGEWKKLHPTVRDNKVLSDETWSSQKINEELGYISHDTLLNTHNLTTDIDHNKITNRHDLTVDIDHNNLTNYDPDVHPRVSFTDTEPTETKKGDLWINYIK